MVKGTGSGFQQRTEQISTGSGPRAIIVWDFRVERKDPEGKPMPRLAVQMRGRSFIGSVANGDVVEIDDASKAGRVLETSRVRNLTSGALVIAKSARLLRLWPLISFVIFVVVALFMFIMFREFAGMSR